ncbi:MAG: glycosyltransferase family 2 protein [Planctomycetota bacterium]|nr:glycosyltransferase family 2 protein [Planctomycetota bacterium]
MLENKIIEFVANKSHTDPVVLPAGTDSVSWADRALDQADQLIDHANRAEATCPLSVVIPVYNERSIIDEIVRGIVALPIHKEILIVDDASDDGTGQLVERLAEQFIEVSVIRHEINRGKGAALQTGFERAVGDVIVVQDADLRYDPKDILMLAQPIIAKRCDVVYGSRFLAPIHENSSWWYRFGNRVFTRLSNIFTGQRLTDVETCYKAFRRGVVREFALRQERFGFEPELTAKIARRGYHISEMPVDFGGRSCPTEKSISIKSAFSKLWCIVRYGIAD